MRLARSAIVLFVATLTLAPGTTKAIGGGADPTDQFLIGPYLNAGLNVYGTLGSAGAAPPGVHTRPSSLRPWSSDGTDQLGITYDLGHDGWGVGRDIGDLFMAGTPYEGFAVGIGTTHAWNSGDGLTELGTGTFSESETDAVTWRAAAPYMGVQLEQAYRISPTSNQLYVTVSMTNVTDSPILDVYYTRCVDPDTIEPESEGQLTTANAVIARVSDSGYAAVWAKSPDESLPSELGLWSYEPSARAHLDCSDPSTDYVGPGTELADYVVSDTTFGITVKRDLLPPGETFTFSLGYGMSLSAIAPPPSLPSTSMHSDLLADTVKSVLLVMFAMSMLWAAERMLEPDLDRRF